MRNPNGYGSITKLSGNRRKPFRVRKTTGWIFYDRLNKCFLKEIPEKADMFEKLVDDELRFQSKQQYENIGYFATRQEAMIALAEYNKNPYDLHAASVTFEDVYEEWSEKHFPKIKNPGSYSAAYKVCKKLYKMRMKDITIAHLQKIIDESGKNTPTLKNVKILWGLMWDYAVLHDIVTPDKRDKIKFVDISKPGNPNGYAHDPFTQKEIETVWKYAKKNEYAGVILMLVYTGVRIRELLNLKKTDIQLNERWFFISKSKTAAGIRKVPIADKILPFFQVWIEKNDCEYLISDSDGNPFQYITYYNNYWKPLISEMKMTHTPHSCRHTCISMLAAAGVDERLVKKIVGHSGQSVTENVYTHFEIEPLLNAINKI